MTTPSTDRIEKRILLRAPRARAWQALTDAGQFGSWFGVNLGDPFLPGKRSAGPLTHPGYEHLTLAVVVERMEAETLFSYRWHPYAIDPAQDYSLEPMTLVEFRLAPAPEGTLLTVVESGFDRIPAHRREEAFRMNEGGWAQQLVNLARHVGG